MGIWGVSMMRDEGDIAYDTVTHLASEGLRGVIVLDNGSVDDTASELKRAGEDSGMPVIVLPDDEVGYYQSDKLTHAAQLAVSQHNAWWILPFDADEIWCHHEWPLAELAERADTLGQRVIWADMWNHYRVPGDAGDGPTIEQMPYRDPESNPLPKVMFRWADGAIIRQGNHDVHLPGHAPRGPHRATIHHFQNRSLEHFTRKARNGAEAYAAAVDLPASMGTHWREFGEMDDDQLAVYYECRLTRRFVDTAYDPAPLRRWASTS